MSSPARSPGEHAEVVREALRFKRVEPSASAARELAAAEASLAALVAVAEPMSCGHPAACGVQADEGTAYCGWCAAVAVAEDATRQADGLRNAIAQRDDYSRKTGCDCHQTDIDPDYSPAYQDEYQRLWHEAAAERDRLAARVAELEGALERIVSLPTDGGTYDVVWDGGEWTPQFKDIARAALSGGTAEGSTEIGWAARELDRVAKDVDDLPDYVRRTAEGSTEETAICPDCDGIGAQAGAHTERVNDCPTCGGTGRKKEAAT